VTLILPLEAQRRLDELHTASMVNFRPVEAPILHQTSATQHLPIQGDTAAAPTASGNSTGRTELTAQLIVSIFNERYRRVIEMSKQMRVFSALSENDQIALLKGGLK
jgi:hypothetical protein